MTFEHSGAWIPEEMVGGLPHDEDSILLVKEWESNMSLSQQPIVIVPHVAVQTKLRGT